MKSRDFCFWLQGFFEVGAPETIDAEKTAMIKRHLDMVFEHEIDPSMPDPDGKLQDIHDGTAKPEPFIPGDTGDKPPASPILRC